MTAVGRSRWTSLLLYGSLTVLAIVWLVPMLSALMTSMLPLSQTRDGWWNLSPADLTFGNFGRAWDQGCPATPSTASSSPAWRWRSP
jgi:ABC-type glycerol-3-phosphate transport system permease component